MSMPILPTAHVSGLAQWPGRPLLADSLAQVSARRELVPVQVDRGLELQMVAQRTRWAQPWVQPEDCRMKTGRMKEQWVELKESLKAEGMTGSHQEGVRNEARPDLYFLVYLANWAFPMDEVEVQLSPELMGGSTRYLVRYPHPSSV